MNKKLYLYLVLVLAYALIKTSKNTVVSSRKGGKRERLLRKKVNTEDIEEISPGRYRTKVKKYFRVQKDTPDPINAEDITIKIGESASDKNSESKHRKRHENMKQKNNEGSYHLNETDLSILWSYYQACRQGLLKSNHPNPWNLVHNNNRSSKSRSKRRFSMRKDKKWHLFLENLIADNNWPEWINDSGKAKEKALRAYNNVQQGKVYSQAASSN